jgi:hypothetical protein
LSTETENLQSTLNMSVYTYIFSPETKEGICLYKRLIDKNPPFEGVITYIERDRYWLPNNYLQLLIDRFSEAHSDSKFIEDYKLWKLIGDDEYIIEIGGDCDWDLPLTKYLPELNDPKVQEEIKQHTELLIR